MRMKRKEAVW
jgi:hypothetical protein